MLVAGAESAAGSVEKGRLMAEIGRIYAYKIEDKSQALVAYAQAFCEDPETAAYADEVERLAGSDPQAWNEATSLSADAAASGIAAEQKTLLLLRLGRWYSERTGRADLAAGAFQEILRLNPNHDAALAGLSAVYQKAQQWPDLAETLLQRASVATPTVAR